MPPGALGPVLLAAAATLPFLPGITDTHIFDDVPAVRRNPDITAASPRGVLVHDFWGGPLASASSHKSYRPLASLSLWLQARLLSPAPAGLKAANVLIHLANCQLLLLLLRGPALRPGLAKGQADELALGAALLFACHPLHVEPVVSIVGRADLLCSFFLLSGCLLTTRSSSRALFPLLAFLSLLALLSKEQGIVLPLFWAAVEILKTGFHRRRLLSSSFLLRLSCPLLTLLLLAWYRLWTVSYTLPTFQPGDNPAAALPTLALRALNLHYYAAVSALLLISPHWLCFDWALGCLAPLASPWDLRALAPLLLWLLLLAAAGRAAKDAATGRPLLLWAGALALLPFLLSSNLLVTVGFVVAERSLYLSVAGAAVAVARGWQRLSVLHPALRPALPAVLLVLALRSATRSADWHSELSLFTSGLAVCPGNAKVFYNIAKVRADSGEVEAAALCYREAVRLAPSYEHALNNLGNLERARGEPGRAARLLRRAVRVSPRFAAAHMNLAIVQQAVGQVQEAEELYLAALGLRSPYADCEYNLANLYLKTGRAKEAEVRLRAAAALGHPLAWGNLVLLLEEEDRPGEAHQAALRAVQLFPDSPDLRFHLANSHGKRDEFAEGESAYLAAISLSPRPRAAFHTNLGVLYHRWGRRSEAAAAYRAALALRPGMVSARENLARLGGRDSAST